MFIRLSECLTNQTGSYSAPFLWMHGENKARIKDELEKIRDSSIKTICLESRTHEDFGEKKWFDDVRFILDFCKENDMKVWILDDKHFPTGYANGVVRKHPELLPWEIKSEYIDVPGPVKDGCLRTDFWLIEGTEILAAVACRHVPDTLIYDEAIDISAGLEDGRIYFDLPEGMWRICLLVKTRFGFSEHYAKYIDMLNPASTQLMIDAVYEPHYENLKEYFGNVFLGFFSDEPCFGNFSRFGFTSELGVENHHLPWRENIYDRLKSFYGEDTFKMFPCIWLSFTDGREKDFRVRYMDAITYEYSHNFCKKLADWCSDHGVEYIGHVIEDNNTHYHTACGSGHYFRALRYQHMSGIDVVLHQILPGINGVDNRGEVCYRVMNNKFFIYVLAKLAASQANLDEHKKGRAMCEIFGAYGWAEGSKMMKYLLDHMLVRGINYFVPHAFSLKPDDDDCPPHFYAGGRNPEYRYFRLLMEYLDRCCHLTASSKPKPVCSLLFDAESRWSGCDFVYMEDIAKVLYDNHIDYEIVPLEQLNDANTDIIIAPEAGYKADELRNLCEKEIIFISEKFTPLNLVKELKKRNLNDITLKDNLPLLRYRRYVNKCVNIYHFSNEDINNRIETEIELKDFNGGDYIEYDALNNISSIKFADKKIKLTLEPYNSVFVITGLIEEFPPIKTKNKFIEKIIPIDTEYKISLAETWGKFDFLTETKELFNISKVEKLKNFAGHVKYETVLEIREDGEYELHLGYVGEIAEIRLADKEYSAKICPPYNFHLGEMKCGKYPLEIITTSHCGYRERDKFSRFLMMEPTGLIGPVRLIKYSTN